MQKDGAVNEAERMHDGLCNNIGVFDSQETIPEKLDRITRATNRLQDNINQGSDIMDNGNNLYPFQLISFYH